MMYLKSVHMFIENINLYQAIVVRYTPKKYEVNEKPDMNINNTNKRFWNDLSDEDLDFIFNKA